MLHLGLPKKAHRSYALGHDIPSLQWAMTNFGDQQLHSHSISVDADANALIDKLCSYAPVDVPKWP
jgi:hypothetical protein